MSLLAVVEAAPAVPDFDAASAAPGTERWALALRVVALLATNPAGIGGVVLRARPGPVRDLWAAALGRVARVRRLPASADAEALDGGLDLTATLAAGRPVYRAGLLAEAAGGILLVPMAERLAPALAARLASALDGADDHGGPLVVLFDEAPDDADAADRVSAALTDRLAIHLDLSRVRLPMLALLAGEMPSIGRVERARKWWARAGISSLRSRRGGVWRVTTLRRW